MIKINFSYSQIENELKKLDKQKIKKVHAMIEEKTGPGNDFLG